jgi:predicted enzyme related to lactoylglutathione lyase
MSNKMDPVVHFEMPAEDRKRMADFYTKAFGWQTQMLGPDSSKTRPGPKRPTGTRMITEATSRPWNSTRELQATFARSSTENLRRNDGDYLQGN